MAHLEVCPACARYDRVIGGGVQVFRTLPAVAPSPDFQTRLLQRLQLMDHAAGRHGSGASLAMTAMICVALGVGAWLPALRPEAEEPVRLPAMVAHAPYHDLSPALMRAQAVHTPPAFLQPRSAFYGHGLLVDHSATFTTLAYRPAGGFQLRR